MAGRRPAGSAEDPPHGRFADLVPELGQFTVHPAVSPGRVLPREPQYQVADLLAGPWAAWPVRIRPLALDQAAVPGQQRARCDEPMGAQHGGQQPGERRQDRSVGPVRLGPGDLTPEHCDLMTEDHDLRVLGRLAAAEQYQPAKDPDRDQVEQTKSHEPRSWRNLLLRPNRRSQHLRRALKRYRASATHLTNGRHDSMASRAGSAFQTFLTFAGTPNMPTGYTEVSATVVHRLRSTLTSPNCLASVSTTTRAD